MNRYRIVHVNFAFSGDSSRIYAPEVKEDHLKMNSTSMAILREIESFLNHEVRTARHTPRECTVVMSGRQRPVPRRYDQNATCFSCYSNWTKGCLH